MDCRQVRDLLVAYLDNEIGSRERLEIESHLAGCEQCRRERDELQTAQRALRTTFTARAGTAEPSKEAWEQLRPGLDISRPSMLFLFRRRRWRIAATVIVVALLLAGLLWAIGVGRGYP
jgi:anti-sigma factor RsiW